MAETYVQGVLAGAQIANMRFERDARMQQLRQQAAQQQMQERLIASQAKMYLQHAEVYKQQAAQDEQDKALLKTAGDRFHTLWSAGMNSDEALRESIAPLMFASPTAFQKAASGLAALTRADAAGQTFTPSISTLKDSSGNKVEVLQTGPNSAAQVKPTEAPFSPSIENLTAPDGRMVPVLRGSKNSAQQLREPGGSGDTPIVRDVAKANEMMKQARALELTGDIDGAKALRDDALFIKDSHAKSGLIFQSDGQGGFQLTQGVPGGKIPNLAVNTKVLERLSASEKAIDGLDDLASTLRPEDVGIKGVVGELVLDKILPQFGAKTADLKRINNRTKLRMLAEGLMRTVSFDTRFSDRDSLRIAKITPSPGMAETSEHSQESIATIKNIFAKRALIDAKEAAQAPPPFAVRALDEKALQESVEKGLLTMEQAKAEFFRRNPNLEPGP